MTGGDMDVFSRRPHGSHTVDGHFRRQPRHLAIIGAATSLILLAAACVADPEDVVRPGPPAAASKAVGHESLPVAKPLPAPAATCTNAPAGWSLRENRQVGVMDVRPSRTATGLGEVVGYLDSATAVCGQTMSVHLSARRGATRLRLRALRIGDYQGLGSRQVWQSDVLTARKQVEAVPTGPDRIITERWPTSTTFAVNASWPPGMYLIEIAPEGQGKPSFMPLIVRSSGTRSPYLVLVSDLTWLAYNDYGGRSLYFGPGKTHAKSVANRSYVASTDRPIAGSGLRLVFSMNIPLVRFLSRNGLSYDVTTDSSLDAVPAQLNGQPTLLIGGHSEYWTKRMYDAAVQARDAGTNLGFLGANEIYWQGRIERDPRGRETALTVYRDSRLDRLAKSNPSTTTVQWRHAPLLRDPAALVGQGMSAVGVSGPYVVNSTPSWLFRGTNLKKGDVLDLAIGNEADAQEHPDGNSPANLQVVLRGVARATGATKPSLITAGYYTAPSGAGVFAAGTTYWVCNLDSTCPDNATPPATSVAIQRITLNLVTAFAVARAGRLHPSVGTAYESAAQLATRLPLGNPAVSTESQHLLDIQRRHR
ncbi:MAG: N,N-dimethylformamidase beta subunit family domain-containing protein [Dermatophilaceae bacterium]